MTLGPFAGFADVQEERFIGAQFEGGFEIGYTEKRAGGGIATMSDNTGRKGGDGW